MRINYFAELEGYSGVRVYSRELKQALEAEIDIQLESPRRWFRPEFLNKPLLNPWLYLRLDSSLLHVTNQDDMAVPFFPERKLVVTIHDIFPHVEEYAGPVYSAAAALYVRQIEKHADKIIAISEFTREQLLENTEIGRDRIEVIYQGVNLDKFSPDNGEIEHDNYYLHVGSEIPRKNIEGLIRIFSKIKEKDAEAKLLRVGEMSKEAKKGMEDQDLEEGEDVIYYSGISDDRLVALYSNAQKLLFPSHGEGFGRPMLESLACGTPVIAYNRKPMSEVLPEEMLCDGEEQEFVETALNLEISRDKCREIAEEYTWEKTARKTIEVYKRLENEEQ